MPLTDDYRVRVWPARSASVFDLFRPGWRTQIDYIVGGDQHADQPLTDEMWFPTRDEAVDWAVQEARKIHTEDSPGAGFWVGPLRVFLGPDLVVNETAPAPVEG